jgi:hypothetical protein
MQTHFRQCRRCVLLRALPSEIQRDIYVGFLTEGNAKVKLSRYRPWRPLGLREVEAPTFLHIRLIDGGKVVSPTRRLLFTPRKIPGTHFC